MNCMECQHYRIEQHISPQIGVCSEVDSKLGCSKCKEFRPIAEWKHCGSGQIICPACRAQQSIPQVDDWRHGCCSIVPNTALTVIPFRGQCACVNAKPIEQRPAACQKPTAKPTSRSLFE